MGVAKTELSLCGMLLPEKNNKLLKDTLMQSQRFFFSPDERKVVSTSKDGSVRLWDVATGQQEYAIAGYRLTDWKVFLYENGVALASETKYGPSTAGEPYVNLWDLNTKKRIKILTGHNDGVKSIDFSDDGKTLISGSRDGTVLVWDIPSIIQETD